MNKTKLLVGAIILAAFVVGIVIGGIFGFKKGYQNRYLFEAAQNASLTASELAILRRGDTEKIIGYQENNLDYLISVHGDYLKHGNPLLIYLYLNLFEKFPKEMNPKEFINFNNNLMRHVANYRKDHPILWSLETVCADPANCPDEIKINTLKTRDLIEQTLEKYGWKP